MDNKWNWLRNYMRDNNISQQKVAEALSWRSPRISELLCGKRDFPVDKVYLAARFFNLNLEDLTKYNSGYDNQIPRFITSPTPTADKVATLDIDIIDAAVSKGRGLQTPPIGRQSVNLLLCQSILPVSDTNLKIIIAHGDAMSPTINDKDAVLADISVTLPHLNGLYLFDIQGELFIKRLCFNELDGTAEIVSDNNLYPPIKVTDVSKLSCLGKIIALCKYIR